MAGEVSFDDKEWRDMLETINKNVKDPKPVLRAAFGTRGFKDIIDHFQAERGPDGMWAEWAESTKAKRGNGKKLQDTGNLRQNFLPGNIRDSGRDSIVFFNSTPYAATHDLGNSSRNIPQREFMYLSDKAQEDMLKIILDLVVKE